jgi:hypothetical protein
MSRVGPDPVVVFDSHRKSLSNSNCEDGPWVDSAPASHCCGCGSSDVTGAQDSRVRQRKQTQTTHRATAAGQQRAAHAFHHGAMEPTETAEEMCRGSRKPWFGA